MARKARLPLVAALSMTALVAPVHALARTHPTRSHATQTQATRTQATRPQPTGTQTTSSHATQSHARIALMVAPSQPLVGHPVTLAVPNPPPSATDYQWQLTGAPAVDTGGSPHATVRFASPGVHRVEVLVKTGATTEKSALTLTVRAAPAHRASGIGRAGGALGATLAPRARLARHQNAHAAASDPTVTIADFQFTPATITIHVGDTVTWVNNGPSAHTATASNNSFNTGVLQKGKTASHTFTTAGTFSYICSIHPFMHGTVIVLANTTTTTPTSTSTTPSTTATTPSTTASQTAGQLPMTGFALAGTVLAGLLLTGVGFTLRKRSRA
jgi:plastocyanin